MNEFYGVLLVSGVKLEIENELTQISFDEFGCTGVQNTSTDFGSVDSLDLPDNLKTMSGGIDESDGQIINEKVFSSNLISLEFYFEGSIEDIKSNIETFKDFLVDNELAENIEIKIEKNGEWRDSYKQFFKSIVVDEELEIIPSWEAESKKQDSVIVIEPGLGFGTGSHETTFLCLKFLKSFCVSESSVLDLGCGSGILGIYTEKFKQSSCDYVDVDPDALENCKLNMQLNNLDYKENVYLRDNFSQKKYDIVIANILLPVLIAEKELILNSKEDGGVIVFSGILSNQIDELKTAYFNSGLVSEVVHFEQKNDWCCLVLK